MYIHVAEILGNYTSTRTSTSYFIHNYFYLEGIPFGVYRPFLKGPTYAFYLQDILLFFL